MNYQQPGYSPHQMLVITINCQRTGMFDINLNYKNKHI